MKAVIFFVGSAIGTYALLHFSIVTMPEIVVMFAVLSLIGASAQRKTVGRTESIEPPVGLGGYFPDDDRESMRRRGHGPFKTFQTRTDERYEEPMATYPGERVLPVQTERMTNEIKSAFQRR